MTAHVHKRPLKVSGLMLAFLIPPMIGFSQASSEAPAGGTSTDLFIMFGSDLIRPSLALKANYNIGLGHTFGFLKEDPIGDEITFSYTYENGGSHGFLHTDYGSHTEALGLMKNFGLPKTKRVSAYTWIQAGMTSMTGYARVESRFYDGESLGAIVHFNDHKSIWIQETFNKVVTFRGIRPPVSATPGGGESSPAAPQQGSHVSSLNLVEAKA
jgi:hypothetical protein